MFREYLVRIPFRIRQEGTITSQKDIETWGDPPLKPPSLQIPAPGNRVLAALVFLVLTRIRFFQVPNATSLPIISEKHNILAHDEREDKFIFWEYCTYFGEIKEIVVFQTGSPAFFSPCLASLRQSMPVDQPPKTPRNCSFELVHLHMSEEKSNGWGSNHPVTP